MKKLNKLLRKGRTFILPKCSGCGYCSHYDNEYCYCDHPQIGGPIPIKDTRDCYFNHAEE